MKKQWENEWDQLEQIQEAEVPEFLLTRIHQQVKNREREMVIPFKRGWLIAAAFIGVMVFNGWMVYYQTTSQKTGSVASELYQVYNSQNIYQ